MGDEGDQDDEGKAWLVAPPAAYRVERLTATTVEVTIRAGTTRFLGRRLALPRSQVEANLALGDLAFTRTKPAWLPPLPTATPAALGGWGDAPPARGRGRR